MPKLLKQQKNTFIYLQGERPANIFLVKEGRIMLSSSEEKKAEGAGTKRIINKGEFFGLFSAIGKFPRQEDALAVTPVEILAFDEVEFENLIAKNSRLSLQLMKMLSQELRKIHKKAQQILDYDTNVSLSDGLYQYAQMYLDNGETDKAKYVLTKFIEAYPLHEKTEKAKEELSKLKS